MGDRQVFDFPPESGGVEFPQIVSDMYVDRTGDERTTFGTTVVEEWQDSVRHEALLEATQALLGQPAPIELGATIYDSSSVTLPWADISRDIAMQERVIGPYTSVSDGIEFAEIIVTDVIVGLQSTGQQAAFNNNRIGNDTSSTVRPVELDVGEPNKFPI